jgi:hypothetical protein
MHTSGSRTSAFARLQIDSPNDQALNSRVVPLRRLIVLAVALLVVPIVRGELFAQQGLEAGEYPPDSGYGQQGYMQQSQRYGQQPYSQQEYADSGEANASQGDGQMQPLNAQDLEQLVAPIALYPDALIAQVLTASTYPEQVADADRWLRAQGYASPDQIAAGADAQPWDPSVKALTAFPHVLSQMDQNLHWTSELGNAYYNEPQDMLEAVQTMRQRAREAGNLQSTPQEAVNYDRGNIEVSPVNPQTVYVPGYDPWAVYGQPVSPYPGFSADDAIGSSFSSSLASSAVNFGLGVAISAFTNTPWGWLGWGLNWLTQSVVFNQSDYFSHSATVADWGLRQGGPRAYSQRGAFAGRGNGFSRNFARYGRSNGEFGRARSQGFARTRNEDAYARNRSGESRGYQTFGARYGRSLGESNRGLQPAVARSQQYGSQQYGSRQYGSQHFGSQQNGSQRYGSQRYGSSAYGSSFRGSNQSYGSRAGASYGSSMRANRGHDGSFQRSGFGNRYSGSSRSNGFAKSSGKREHSSGSSHFGGGHNSAKNSGGGKSFSHGHSGGRGHSGGHSHSGGGGKHHH